MLKSVYESSMATNPLSLLNDSIVSESKESEVPRTTLTSKGQLTLPKALRDRLRLEAGDRIDFSVDDKGRLIGVPARKSGPATPAGSLRHLAKRRPVSLEEMDRAIRERHGKPTE